jgi:DNA-binding transcriptional regulator YiaG
LFVFSACYGSFELLLDRNRNAREDAEAETRDDEFAEAFHLPMATLRDWEQRRSTPDAPARALPLAIERDPEVRRRLLSDRAA